MESWNHDRRIRMIERNETSITVKKPIRDKLKMLSIKSGKKLYELVAEAIPLLEAKYNQRLDSE